MRKGSLVTFIPGAIALFLYILVLVFVSVQMVEIEPQIDLQAETTLDYNNYQTHTALNALLADESEFVRLVREYGNADQTRKSEIEDRLRGVIEQDFSSVQDYRVDIVFASGEEISIGDGRVTRSRSVVSTPKGAATVAVGLEDIERGGST